VEDADCSAMEEKHPYWHGATQLSVT